MNRGSTFWFHITLDLNEGMLSLAPSLPDLSGKTLAYIESNPTAAQATLNMLSITQLVITHSPTLGQLPPATMTSCWRACPSRSATTWRSTRTNCWPR